MVILQFVLRRLHLTDETISLVIHDWNWIKGTWSLFLVFNLKTNLERNFSWPNTLWEGPELFIYDKFLNGCLNGGLVWPCVCSVHYEIHFIQHLLCLRHTYKIYFGDWFNNSSNYFLFVSDECVFWFVLLGCLFLHASLFIHRRFVAVSAFYCQSVYELPLWPLI